MQNTRKGEEYGLKCLTSRNCTVLRWVAAQIYALFLVPFQRRMAHFITDGLPRILILLAALFFIILQMRLFSTQSEYADRIAAAVEAENRCARQVRGFIDQISSQQGKIVALEEEKQGLETTNIQLSSHIQELEGKTSLGVSAQPIAAVVIMACNRADYLERTIASVLKYHGPVASKFPLFISQDGDDKAVRIMSRRFYQLTYMQHIDLEPPKKESSNENVAYYKIARHYRWALTQLFDNKSFPRVIILEDDMEIAPDFFGYFEATAPLLDQDSSLVAVSSWNDNGQKQLVQDPEALYRSDFFPGLGWMLTKTFWNELSSKWPKAYWDDWLRSNQNRKNRQIIRPEVCRTYNFGEHGSSYGQFYKQYLEPIKLNDVPVSWKSKNLSYLLEEEFQKHFSALLYNSVPILANEAAKAYNIDGDVRIEYDNQRTFQHLARQFGIFEEWKEGIPRTSYKGVVVIRWQTSRRIFLVASDSPLQRYLS